MIGCGFQATHILPVLDGRLDIQHCRRINIGGAHVDGFMQRLLQLKYPGHLSAITLPRAEVGNFFVYLYCVSYIYLDELTSVIKNTLRE